MSEFDGYMQLVHFTPNDSALACTLCGNVVWDFARHFRAYHPEAAIRSQEPPTGPESWGTYTCVHCGITSTGARHDAGSQRGMQRCGSESGLPYGYNTHPASVPCDNPWTSCLGSVTPPTARSTQ